MAETAASGRGGDTRARLLGAGLRLFGTEGYDGVSTRQLAREAGVNIAAIAYHFGGKRALYRAVLGQLVADTDPMIAPVAAQSGAQIKAARGDPAQLARLAAGLVAGLAQVFLPADFMRYRAPLLIREYLMPSDDFDILYEGRTGPLHRILTELAAAALGLAPDDSTAAIRAHTIVGQIFIFGIARVVLERRLGWDGYTKERSRLIVDTVTASVLASLDLPAVNAREEIRHGD